jgi:integrase
MELLGHTGIRTRLNVYTHVAPVMAKDAAEHLNAALGG